MKQNCAPKNNLSKHKGPQNENNHSNCIVMDYRSMSGTNIRMCIVTVCNCILLVY